MKVEEYWQQWQRKVRGGFECFFNEHDPQSVIQHKKHSKAQVVHSMLWPGLVVCICGIIFLRLEMTRRGLTCCGDVQQGTTYIPNRRHQQSCRDAPGQHSKNGEAGCHEETIALTSCHNNSECIAPNEKTNKSRHPHAGGSSLGTVTSHDATRTKRQKATATEALPVKAEASSSGDVTHTVLKDADGKNNDFKTDLTKITKTNLQN